MPTAAANETSSATKEMITPPRPPISPPPAVNWLVVLAGPPAPGSTCVPFPCTVELVGPLPGVIKLPVLGDPPAVLINGPAWYSKASATSRSAAIGS